MKSCFPFLKFPTCSCESFYVWSPNKHKCVQKRTMNKLGHLLPSCCKRKGNPPMKAICLLCKQIFSQVNFVFLFESAIRLFPFGGLTTNWYLKTEVPSHKPQADFLPADQGLCSTPWREILSTRLFLHFLLSSLISLYFRQLELFLLPTKAWVQNFLLTPRTFGSGVSGVFFVFVFVFTLPKP